MATGVNRVTLVGNLGRDPEVRYTQGGSAVCNLRLAVTERRKSGDEWKDHTEWVAVVAFGKMAENCGQYLQKGRQVYVEGRIQTRSYKDKDGIEKWSTEVLASQVLFLGGNPAAGNGERRPSGNGGGDGNGQALAPAGPVDGTFIDDDLPF